MEYKELNIFEKLSIYNKQIDNNDCEVFTAKGSCCDDFCNCTEFGCNCLDTDKELIDHGDKGCCFSIFTCVRNCCCSCVRNN